MTTKELKEKYLKFFSARGGSAMGGEGHKIIPSASLIPENDPGALFISAGMHPLVPYLLGEKHPMGDKLVNVQKCIRTGDIDDVGDDWHLTFFEMLGNWGLGSYWKKESIKMSWEFLTDKKWLGLDKQRISVSVFAGDSDAPKDNESAKIWKSLGVKNIKFLGKEDNWWGQSAGGPCGPDTEIFYDGVEIWNNVFMEYNKTVDGKIKPLKQKNVDTGMGLERTTAILNNAKSVYDIEPLKSIVEAIKQLSEIYNERSARIIADHIRASVFIIADGVGPSNTEQGYVLRRLIRRAILFARKLGIKDIVFTQQIGDKIIDLMASEYPELRKNDSDIILKLISEGSQFEKTLEKGLKEFDKLPLDNLGKAAFDFFSTLGFPLEMFLEELKNKNIKYDEKEIQKKFQRELKEHQELSRTATAGKFKSGLANNSEQVIKYHTATHLLLAALRKVLGKHVFQKGSNITAERLRFDFSHSEKLTKEQVKEVEDVVNEQIQKGLPVCCEEMSLEDAKKKNAMGVFESKYGDRVKVYSVGTSDCPYSCEICSGPHVTNTNQLGHFKIIKEEASSSGVRRIKAILE